MTPNDLLAGGYRMGRQLVHMMVDDLTAEEFRYQPVPGVNSAAWIVGHLAVVARRTAHRLGCTDLPGLTEEFIARFSVTKKAAAAQLDLGEKAELLSLLDVCVEKVNRSRSRTSAGSTHEPTGEPQPVREQLRRGTAFRHDAYGNAQRAAFDHPTQPR